MKPFVLDNSVVMSWCFKDEENQYADNVLDYLSDATALVPSVWPLEVMNILLSCCITASIVRIFKPVVWVQSLRLSDTVPTPPALYMTRIMVF